jgi:hypothetical protein
VSPKLCVYALTQPSLAEADPVPDAFFEPSISDVQAYHASVISRSKRLNEAPLLTSKYREADRAERDKKKSQRWPTVGLISWRQGELTLVDNYKDQILGWDSGPKYLPVDQPVSPRSCVALGVQLIRVKDTTRIRLCQIHAGYLGSLQTLCPV